MNEIAARRLARQTRKAPPARAVKAEPVGGYRVEKMSASRQIAMDGYAAMPPGHKMLALLELDVTEAERAISRLRADGVRVSLFSFVVSSIAHVIAELPALNVIHEGARLFQFDDVDVNVPVEVHTSEGPMPRQVVVRRAQDKSAVAVFADLEEARRRFDASGLAGVEDRMTRRLARFLMLAPRFLRLWFVRRLVHSARAAKRFAGTTSVTSVGKFASIPGFVVPYMNAPQTVMFALGSVVEKPVFVSGAVVPRSFLALTMVVDHDVVDGGPVARFAKRLQELIESPRALDAP